METIQIQVTDEQRKALAQSAPDTSIQDIAQLAWDDKLQPMVDYENKILTTNLANFIQANPEVAQALKTKHNLDDSFLPIEK